jgi:branched-subunit amino acid transport protein
MDQDLIFVTILGMTLVTYLPRLLPVVLMSSRELPRLLEVWLSFVPPAVLAALVAPSLLIDQEKISLAPENVFIWASIPTVIIAAKTKNLFLSVLSGMAIVAIVRLALIP